MGLLYFISFDFTGLLNKLICLYSFGEDCSLSSNYMQKWPKSTCDTAQIYFVRVVCTQKSAFFQSDLGL